MIVVWSEETEPFQSCHQPEPCTCTGIHPRIMLHSGESGSGETAQNCPNPHKLPKPAQNCPNRHHRHYFLTFSLAITSNSTLAVIHTSRCMIHVQGCTTPQTVQRHQTLYTRLSDTRLCDSRISTPDSLHQTQWHTTARGAVLFTFIQSLSPSCQTLLQILGRHARLATDVPQAGWRISSFSKPQLQLPGESPLQNKGLKQA